MGLDFALGAVLNIALAARSDWLRGLVRAPRPWPDGDCRWAPPVIVLVSMIELLSSRLLSSESLEFEISCTSHQWPDRVAALLATFAIGGVLRGYSCHRFDAPLAARVASADRACEPTVHWAAAPGCCILVLPGSPGSFLSEVLNQVGLYVLMGLGLNIVVGFAGMLDLGYVAFFAIGAYTTALLTSPIPRSAGAELLAGAADRGLRVGDGRPASSARRCCACAATTWRSSRWASARSSACWSLSDWLRPCSAAPRAS